MQELVREHQNNRIQIQRLQQRNVFLANEFRRRLHIVPVDVHSPYFQYVSNIGESPWDRRYYDTLISDLNFVLDFATRLNNGGIDTGNIAFTFDENEISALESVIDAREPGTSGIQTILNTLEPKTIFELIPKIRVYNQTISNLLIRR